MALEGVLSNCDQIPTKPRRVIDIRQVGISTATDPSIMPTTRAVLDASGRTVAAPALAPPGLSRRQREVLELLGEGVPAREIAVRLGLAEPTVRNHIRLVLRKLDCHSQLEAVAVAYRLDLLRRETPSGTVGQVASSPTA
jgi:DNA-binding CsgD family transcriptional regulator